MFDVKIGIIGLGFVGQAIKDNCDSLIPLCLLDVDNDKGTTGTYDELQSCDGIFVCVPSPSLEDGSCDTSILETVLSNLTNFRGVIISKTTAPPDVYKKLQSKYPNLVHCPEFLTSKNSSEDYAKQSSVIIGGEVNAYKREAYRLIALTKPKINVYYCSIEEAAMAKYIINCFLATKVVFMNEMFNLTDKAGLDWKRIKFLIDSEPRIGTSHTQVPGYDGYFGFGGSCFPKDTTALLNYAKSLNVNLNILKEAVQKNILLRLHEPK